MGLDLPASAHSSIYKRPSDCFPQGLGPVESFTQGLHGTLDQHRPEIRADHSRQQPLQSINPRLVQEQAPTAVTENAAQGQD
jgi:hypothetical protein